MIRALILIGSPRGKKSTSTSLGSYLLKILDERGWDTEILWVNRQLADDEKLAQMLDAIDRADIIVLTAPLYDDCQPYIVTRTMEAISFHLKNLDNKRFIPIINCGFPEPEHITAVTISIYHKFAASVGFKWAGSLAIGGGEMLQGARGKTLDDLGKMARKVKKELERIADALAADSPFPDTSIRVVPDLFNKPFMKKVITRMNNHGWKSRAKKNGGVVDAQPYSQLKGPRL
jgi:hypothetical protein